MLNSLVDICIAYILIVATMSIHNIAINHLTPNWLWTTKNKWGKCLRQCVSHYIINTIIITMVICYTVGIHQPNNLLGRISVSQDILSDNAGHSIELNGVTHVGPTAFYTYINNHVANELNKNPDTHLFIEGVRNSNTSDQYHFPKEYIKSLNDQNIPKICALDTRYDKESTPLYALTAQLLKLANQDECFIYYAIRDGIPIYDVDAIITNTPTTKNPPPIKKDHAHIHQHVTNPPKSTLSTTSSSETADASINHVVQTIADKKYIPVSAWFEDHPRILSIASIITRGYINIRTGADTIVTTIKYPLYHWNILKNPSDPDNDPDNQYIIHYRNTLLCNGMEKYPANHIILVYGQAHIADIEAQWIKRHPNWHVTKHQYNTEDSPAK